MARTCQDGGVLPLRPLTLGELLDAAVALLRGRAKMLLAAGFVLALIEQAVLYNLRVGTARPPYLLPYDDRLELYWLALAVMLVLTPVTWRALAQKTPVRAT